MFILTFHRSRQLLSAAHGTHALSECFIRDRASSPGVADDRSDVASVTPLVFKEGTIHRLHVQQMLLLTFHSTTN